MLGQEFGYRYRDRVFIRLQSDVGSVLAGSNRLVSKSWHPVMIRHRADRKILHDTQFRFYCRQAHRTRLNPVERVDIEIY